MNNHELMCFGRILFTFIFQCQKLSPTLQRQLICTLLDINNIDIFYENLLSKVADKVGPPFLDKIIDLGLLSEEPVLKLGSPLDTFSQFIASKLSLSMIYMYITSSPTAAVRHCCN